MPKSSVTVEIVFNKLPKIQAAMQPKASAIIRQSTFEIASAVKAKIVEHDLIDTGTMLGEVSTAFPSDMEGIVYDPAEYWIHHEYGTVHLPAKPMVQPSVEAAKGPFLKRMEELVDGG
ncbi:MAG: hypothetical protein M3P51_15580 [Chloroflexota bacterium]|nr:hypothetical protein [Chloroflexota bacterium]